MSEKAAEHNYRMALMFYRTERYEDAIAILDDLALQYPDSKHVLYALTKCFLKVGRYQEARDLCRELITRHEDERAQDLLVRIGDRKDTYKPQTAFREAPPDLPADVTFETGVKQSNSPPQISTPADDTTSSWMSSTPTGLMSGSDPGSAPGPGGHYSSPPAATTSVFTTPPPIPDPEVQDAPLVNPPPVTQDSGDALDKGARRTVVTNRNMLIACLVLAVSVLVLWLAFAPLQFIFPEDHSIGTVVIRELSGSRVKWTEHDEAKGQVSIPQRRYIGLVASPELTEADLVLLQKASWLKYIDFSKSNISDAMIEPLAELRQLEVVDVRGTGLTQEGIQRLREWLPQCTVRFDVNAPPKPVAQKPNPPPDPPPEPASAPVPASPAATSSPAASSAEDTPPEQQAPGPRNLVFGELVGDLHIRPWDAPGDAEWRLFKPAKGRVAISAGQVVKLSVRIGSSRFNALRHLEPGDIHTLDVSAARIEDGAVPFMARLTGLRALAADDAQITNAGLEQLCVLSGLQQLSLAGADRFDGAGMAKLSALKELERLVLRGTNVTDDSMRHVGRLSKLSFLDLTRTKISDAGLAHIAQLDRLRDLVLSHAGISGPGLAHLRALDALERVDLTGNAISAEGVKCLGECKHLRAVQLDGAAITDKTLLYLARSRTLSQVQLINTKVTPDGIAALRKALPECSVVASGASRQ